MLIALCVTLTLLSIGFIVFALFFKRDMKNAAKPVLYLSQSGKEVPVFQRKKLPELLLLVLLILFLCNTFAIVFFASRVQKSTTTAIVSATPSISIALSESPVPETASPVPQTAPPSEKPALPDSQSVVWLDDLTPYSDYRENFSIGGWSDRSPFFVGKRTYKHGVGMRLCGTSKETQVDEDETPTGFFLRDCKQVSIDYALRENYSKLVFSLGVDATDERCFGPKETNGLGRVIIADISKGGRTILFDSKWKEYTYAIYETELPMERVDLLEITVMTCGYGGKRVTDGLRFALIDPILFLTNNS